jgi:hypothetical protein
VKQTGRKKVFKFIFVVFSLVFLVVCLSMIAVINLPANVSVSTERPFQASQQVYPNILLTPNGEITATIQNLQADWPPILNTETPILIAPTQIMTNTPTPDPFVVGPFVYGYSFEGRELLVYRIGHGAEARALIGGIHGGYEWNTTVLVNEFQRYLTDSPELIPAQITLFMIPCANPDGAAAGTDRITGRMNGNGVDLNRNWDYQWQPVASHGPWPVSGGSSPFSEPETAALRDFILSEEIQSVIFYHSAMSEVYPGVGTDTSKTLELAQLMASITGYRFAPEGIPGQITTGDAADWLTVNGITAVEVDLSSHEEIDWDKNLQALLAFLNWDLPY